MAVQRRFFIGLIFLLCTISIDHQDNSRSWIRPHRSASVNALYYNNRNECTSREVDYKFTFAKYIYTLEQRISIVPNRSVSECFFYMDMEFQLYKAELYENSTRVPIELEFFAEYFVARIVNGYWTGGSRYEVRLEARKPFKKAEKGIVFRSFRHPGTKLK